MVKHKRQIGVFGKIPERGDFISAGLPRSFMDKAENWIRQGLSQAAQNPNWRDGYLSSPIWQFAAARGVWDDYAWCGIIMPSVDSIGRNFPLLIAVQNDEMSLQMLTATESLALNALSPNFPSIEDWKMRILSLQDTKEAIRERAFLTPPRGATFRALNTNAEVLKEYRSMTLTPQLFVDMISPIEDLVSEAGAS